MYEFEAYAVRKDEVIQVALSGLLANSCYSASVKDKYPGGNIVYIVDPGTAQIFIEETMKPNNGICLMMLVPWFSSASILDANHNHVSVFINGELAIKVDVKNEPTQYRVIALTASPDGANVGCSVIPSDAPYLAIYSSVYGPASKSECEQWRQINCTPR